MSDTYTKLFSSITASTIVGEPVATRWAWVTMLAAVKSDGCVYGSIPGLARLANLTIEDIEIALACFLGPDPYSRTQDNGGRRIEVIDGGWRLLNHAKYDNIRSEAERAEYKREWDRTHRPSGHARKSDSPTVRQQSDTSPTKPDSPTPSTSTSTSVNQDQDQDQEHARPAKRGTRLPARWEPSADLAAWVKTDHPSVAMTSELAKFRDYWAAKAGAGGVKLDWDATFRNWIRNSTTRSPHGNQRNQPSSAVERVREANREAGFG